MEGSFFGFDSSLPSLGSGKSEDYELLTADIEDEIQENDPAYDALNEQTFGDDIPVGDDWEGNDCIPGLRDSLNGSDRRRKQSSSTPTVTPLRTLDASGLEKLISPLGEYPGLALISSTDNRDFELEKSINQLVLDDDEDYLDIGRAIPTKHRNAFRSSPPPPAILELDLTGSPITSSIWSSIQEPSKTDRLKEVLGIKTSKNVIAHSSSVLEDPCIVSLSNKIPNVPILPKIRTLEDLERDLLDDHNRASKTASPIPPGAMSLEDVERDLHQQQQQQSTARFVSDIEREMVTSRPMHSPLPNQPPPGLPFPMMPLMNHLNPQMNGTMLHHPYGPLIVPPPLHPCSPQMMVNMPMQNHLKMIPPQLLALASRLNRPFPNNIVPPDQQMLIANLRFPPPPIAFNQQGMMPMPPGFDVFQRFNNRHNMRNQNIPNHLQQRQYYNRPRPHDTMNNHNWCEENGDEDEYANLMTDREKQWLIRVQLIQLQCEKPHIDDCYHTTYMAKKRNEQLAKKESQESQNVESLLSRVRSESRSYEPIQYVGSLGKLQATSVHFPRRMIDVNVMNVDDGDSKLVNKDVLRFKQTLLEVEKIYTTVLEYEDAINEMEACENEQERTKHETARDEALVKLLASVSAFGEEKMGQIMAIRKGRHLLHRILPLLKQIHIRKLILGIFLNFPTIARRDQNDRVLFNFLHSIKTVMDESDFEQVVELNRRLQNQTDSSKQKHLGYVLQNELGMEVMSLLILRSEQLYEEKKTSSDLEYSWSAMMEYLLQVIQEDSPLRSNKNILNHLHRFTIDRAKLPSNNVEMVEN